MTLSNSKTEEWNLVRLGDVTEIQSGGTPSSSKLEYWEKGTILWATLPDLKSKYIFDTTRKITELGLKKSSAKILPINTVIYSSRATLGEISIAKKETSTNQGSKNFICNSNKISYEYLYYLLKSKKEEINTHATGATYKEINKTTFANIEVLLPSIDTQSKITEILSNYDDLIENNEKRIMILESMAQKLYTEWFVKFKFPEHKKTKMVDSGHPDFGMIPEGWKIKGLDEISNILSGFAFKGNDFQDYGIPVIKIKNIRGDNTVDSSNTDFISESILNERIKKYILKNGDMIVAMTGATAGKVGRVSSNKILLLNQRVAKIEPKEDCLYAFCWGRIDTERAQRELYNLAGGAAQPNMSANQIGSIKVSLPTKDILQKYKEISGPILDEILNLQQQNQNLKKYRDILIPQLVGDKLLIKE